MYIYHLCQYMYTIDLVWPSVLVRSALSSV